MPRHEKIRSELDDDKKEWRCSKCKTLLGYVITSHNNLRRGFGDMVRIELWRKGEVIQITDGAAGVECSRCKTYNTNMAAYE